VLVVVAAVTHLVAAEEVPVGQVAVAQVATALWLLLVQRIVVVAAVGVVSITPRVQVAVLVLLF
jgi:hypothetical protein